MKSARHIICYLLLLITFTHSEKLEAQIVFTPQNMGLGGGGTAYITGAEALFVNPANLYIRENMYSSRLSLLNGGLYFDELYPKSFGLNRFNRLFDTIQLNSTEIDRRPVSDEISDNLIEGNFGDRQQTNTVIHRMELFWFGIKWIRSDRTYAIAARTRLANKFNVGQGLFTTSSFDEDGSISRNQFFSHTTQALHEISFGFGESFTFLNGQRPGLSEFIVGIAPKIVIPGSYQDVEYDRDFELEPDRGNWESTRAFRQISAGSFTETSQTFFSEPVSFSENVPAPLLRDLLQPRGIGFGLDAGITYLITLGDDLSVLQDANTPTEKSLRLSLSITDLGFVLYNSDAFRFESETDAIALRGSPPISGFIYEGTPNEHYPFLAQFNDFKDLSLTETRVSDFAVGLPTSMQAGAVFQYNRLKAVGDIRYSVIESAFTLPGVAIYTGLELRPLSYLPLRAGTRFANDMPGYISLGVGIEAGFVHLNGSVLIRNRGAGFENELLGMSSLGLTLYF